MIYSIIILINEYFEYPTNMLTRVAHQTPIQFPAITFFHMRELSLAKYCKKNNHSPICSPDRSASSYYEFLSDEDYFMNEYYYEIDDTMLKCSFNYEDCDTKSDFILENNYYTFNKGVSSNGTKLDIKNISFSHTSFKGGLEALIFFGNPDIDNVRSFIISVFNQGYDPYFLEHDEHIYVTPGYLSKIVINRNVIRRLEKPHGNFIKDLSKSSEFNSSIFHYISRVSNVKYTQKYCFQLCTEREINLNCNCSTWGKVGMANLNLNTAEQTKLVQIILLEY